MSVNKEVKVKLSADSSKFEKALSKLEKTLKNFIKDAEKLNKTKTDKLEKSIESVNKTSKKLLESFKDTKKEIEKLNKLKLDKLSKDMANSLKATEKVKNEVEKIKKALDQLNKVKITSLTSQLTNLDKSTSNNTKEFTKLKSVIDSLSSSKISSLNTSIKTLNSSIDAVNNDFKALKATISSIDTSSLSRLKSTLDSISQVNINNLSSQINKIGTASLDANTKVNTLYQSLNKIKNISLGNISTQINNIGSSASSSASNVDDLYSSLSNVSNVNVNNSITVSTDVSSLDSISKSALLANANFSKLGQTLKTLSFSGISKGVTSINQFNTSTQSMVGSIAKGIAQFAIFSSGINKVTSAINNNSKATKDSTKATQDSTKATSQNETELQQLTNKIKQYEAEIIKTKKAIEEYGNSMKKGSSASQESINHMNGLVNKLNQLQQELSQAKNQASNLGSAFGELSFTLDEDSSALSGFGDVLKNLAQGDTAKWLGSIKDGFTGMFKAIKSGDIKGITSSVSALWSTFSLMPPWAKVAAGIALVVTALKKLYDAGKQRFFEGLNDISSTFSPLVNTFEKIGSSAKQAFEHISDTNLSLSSLMSIGINFENQMAKVAGIAGAVGTGLADLTESAKLLGGQTRYTSEEVAQAFEYQAMAGYSVDEMLASISSTLDLATISGTSLAETSDIVTDNMTALGLSASQTSDYVDKLAATITSANTSVPQFGNAMENVGPVAGGLGINMTDLATAIGLASNAGVKGSKAGTALKSVLVNLSAPTNSQAQALESLGMSADKAGSYLKTTAEGNVDLEATMKTLMEATKGMTKSQQEAILAQIAGKHEDPIYLLAA